MSLPLHREADRGHGSRSGRSKGRLGGGERCRRSQADERGRLDPLAVGGHEHEVVVAWEKMQSVCVCVCERERERERDCGLTDKNLRKTSQHLQKRGQADDNSPAPADSRSRVVMPSGTGTGPGTWQSRTQSGVGHGWNCTQLCADGRKKKRCTCAGDATLASASPSRVYLTVHE